MCRQEKYADTNNNSCAANDTDNVLVAFSNSVDNKKVAKIDANENAED